MNFKGFSLASALTMVTAGLSFADPISVTVEPGRFESEAALLAHIESTLRGADARIVAVDAARGRVDLDGSDAAARALRADPAILDVGFVIPAAPRLQRVMIEIDGGETSANQVAFEEGYDRTVSGPTGWPGEVLAIEAYDARGEIVTTVFVRDPRFVRYEGWNPDGSHETGSNQAFVDESIAFDIILELPADVESVRVFDRLDPRADPASRRDLGQVAIGRREDAQ